MIGSLTCAQCREVDRLALERFGIPGIVLMENAGRNAAELLCRSITPTDAVLIACGRGNNGGDGFVLARHLVNRGVRVSLLTTTRPEAMTGDAAVNANIAQRMGIPAMLILTASDMESSRSSILAARLLVDALLGTGFSGEVRPPFDAIIHAFNAASGRRIAIDTPSGFDCDSGRPGSATFRADETITFVSRKVGFDSPGAEAYTGHVHVCDIGAPREIVNLVRAVER